VGHLDTKHFGKLVDHLETLRINKGELLVQGRELLSAEGLFGPALQPERTRFTIISTKFLGDVRSIDFWVSRLLMEISRWASRHPSPGLQALVMLDEADIYLPALRKPATKEPMLDLLRRARSAGIGVLLATQSPGDLDYKSRDNIRTWFLGRIAEKTALDTMKPLLSEARTGFAGKLATARVGEFFRLMDGDVLELKAGQSALRAEQLADGELLAVARACQNQSESRWPR
jgi:DNA helicase HerA-like ATPase